MPIEALMPMLVVLVFNVGDVVTGFAKGAYRHELSSTKMRDGLWHKAGFILLMVTAYAVDFAGGLLDLGFPVLLATPVAVFIVLTEVVSILENLSDMIPQLKSSKLMQLFHSSKADEVGVDMGTDNEEAENGR